ncbi:MAG: hypothetical protein ACRESZ_21525 [Methylococcales bacterium]
MDNTKAVMGLYTLEHRGLKVNENNRRILRTNHVVVGIWHKGS